MSATPVVLYTIGHSTRSADAFLALLQAHGIRRLADVRTVPASGRHPQFEMHALDGLLGAQGTTYRHFPELGGLRKPRPDSSNTGWRHPGFRGYADYMQTEAFAAGLEALLAFGADAPTAIMCAEAVWWRCHRRLLADAVLARGVPVRHILSAAEAKPHHLNEYARVSGTRVTYPGLL